MSVFTDKKFDELDWVSQAIEPMDSELNNILASLPDLLDIDFQMFIKILYNYRTSMSVESVVFFLVGKNLGWMHRDVLAKCFKLQIETTSEVFLNFETRTIENGTVRLIKIIHTIDERDLENILGQNGLDCLSGIRVHKDNFSRANEILELLGKCEIGLRTKSEGRKRSVLISRMREIFKTNEWKIKDTRLADKIGVWVHSYITDGNLASYSNFCRLKLMTHKEQAIYSMEEVQ
jgi:hypothetical protein